MTNRDQGWGVSHPPIGRGEVWLLVAILACGISLRVARMSATTIEHFDEGVYASNLWFLAEEGGEYPGRYLYAPPLLPLLIESSMFLLGAGHVGTMLPVLLAGCATLPLVWWVARSWFGAPAGLAAVSLAAFSDFHAQYSRTALTDVLLCLWVLLSVFAIWNCLVTGRHRWTAIAGIAIGLAWWTKYNGWLPLAIGLAGSVAWVVVNKVAQSSRAATDTDVAANQPAREPVAARPGSTMGTPVSPPVRTILLRWILVATIAFSVWSPVLIGLQSKGGYAAVAANHRRYVVGMSGWVDSLLRQSGSHWHFSGLSSCAGIAVAIGLAAFASRSSSTWNRLGSAKRSHAGQPESAAAHGDPQSGISLLGWIVCLAAVGLLAGLAALGGSTVVLAAMAAAGILLRLAPVLKRSASRIARTTDLQTWLLAAWFFGLFAVTPMYWPYPRLTLPWLIASWLGTAALIGRLGHIWQNWTTADNRQPQAGSTYAWIIAATCLVVGVGCMAAAAPQLNAKGLPAWQPRTGLESAAVEMVAEAAVAARGLPRDPGVLADFVIYVYGEPGLFFHLSRLADQHGNFAVQPASSLGFEALPVPTYMAIGPHGLRSERFGRDWPISGRRFRLIGSHPDRASDLVLLNQYSAREIESSQTGQDQQTRLYLLK